MRAYWIDRQTEEEAVYVIDVTPAKRGTEKWAAYQASLAQVQQINVALRDTHRLVYRPA